jgi:hypothetical protein
MITPYNDNATNLIYNLLFCDNIELYKENTPPPYAYPFDVLFAEVSSVEDLKNVAADAEVEPRLKRLAYNRLLSKGSVAVVKELLAVIIEVGLEDGLDVLASFKDGTARYIHQTGKILIWETADATSMELTQDLFRISETIVERIGPWDKPRRPHPAKGTVRITFLVSDGLYFGEGPMNVLFADAMAGPALTSGTQLLSYITGKATASTMS